MTDLVIKMMNTSGNALPEYATEGSSGMDLRADLVESINLKPLERILVPTGIYMEIPIGYEAQVRPRSGLAVNKGITCLNTPGTIDSDYRGEVKVLLVNLGSEEQVILPGDRIAQIVFVKIERVNVTLAEELTQTIRAAGGFGHTGIK